MDCYYFYVSNNCIADTMYSYCTCLIRSLRLATIFVGASFLLGYQSWASGIGSATELFGMGFGFSDLSPSLTSQTFPLVTAAIIANTPQVIISFLYLSYNGIITCMILAHETQRFAEPIKGRRSLRMTSPGIRQRGSYFLQVPFRYAIPLMATTSALHYILSRSIFLVNLNIYDTEGAFRGSIQQVAWSPAAVVGAVVFILTLSIVLCVCACKRFPVRMPLLRSNTLAIAAACHPHKDDTDAAFRPVAYGVLRADGDKQRVGFSSFEVDELQRGEVYH